MNKKELLWKYMESVSIFSNIIIDVEANDTFINPEDYIKMKKFLGEEVEQYYIDKLKGDI